jgi:hypothetical protein
MPDNREFYGFGAGDLFMVPLTGADKTPVMFNLHDFELDIKFENKVLHGRNSFPLKVARGKGTVSGKLKNATVNGAAYNRCFLGDAAQVSTAGQLCCAVREALAFDVGENTSQVAHHAEFQLDLGAWRVDVGQQLTKTTVAPGVGQDPTAGTYYLDPDTGTYHVNPTDKAGGIIVSYTWMSNSGTTTTLTNQPMGTGPQCKAVYTTSFEGRQATLQLNMTQLIDLKMAVKNDDFMIPEQSYQAFADIAGVVGVMSFGA